MWSQMAVRAQSRALSRAMSRDLVARIDWTLCHALGSDLLIGS